MPLALALSLARDPDRLTALRSILVSDRAGCALFDTPRLARQIEAAFSMMWDRHQRGSAPVGFEVPNLA